MYYKLRYIILSYIKYILGNQKKKKIICGQGYQTQLVMYNIIRRYNGGKIVFNLGCYD